MPTIIDDAFYLVQRGNFNAEGVERERGEIVDTSNWRTVRPMVDTRRLIPVPIPIADVITCECGRRWLDDEASARHNCPARRTQTKRPRRTTAAA